MDSENYSRNIRTKHTHIQNNTICLTEKLQHQEHTGALSAQQIGNSICEILPLKNFYSMQLFLYFIEINKMYMVFHNLQSVFISNHFIFPITLRDT